MSLILEALKKLERDRHTHERGFLVLSQPAWRPADQSHWTRGPALLGVAALGGAAVAAALLWSPRDRPTPAAPAAVTAREVEAPAAAVQAPGERSFNAASASTSTRSSAAAPPSRVDWPADPRARATKAAATLATPPHATPERASAPPPTAPAQAEMDAEPAVSDAEAPAEDAPVTGPLRLEAIAQRDGQPVAVVSGQLVRVGDVIGASTVVRIGVAEIELETDGVRRILRF